MTAFLGQIVLASEISALRLTANAESPKNSASIMLALLWVEKRRASQLAVGHAETK